MMKMGQKRERYMIKKGLLLVLIKSLQHYRMQLFQLKINVFMNMEDLMLKASYEQQLGMSLIAETLLAVEVP